MPGEIRYPQTFHKVAELDRYRPGLSIEQAAEEIGSTPLVVRDARQYIERFQGDVDAAIRHRNAVSLRSAKKTRDEARMWRKQVDTEWKASGIPDPVVSFEPGTTKFEMVATIDRLEPGLTAQQIADRIKSTANTVGTYRFWLRKAKGDARLAYQMQRKGVPVGAEGPDV